MGISVCLIVKNNEESLFNCLKSIKNLADEIIVVDTGSVDKTKEMALSFGAKVYDFKWNGNFSEAKNYALDLASCDWILEIDADESISGRDHGKILELVKNDKYLGYYLVQRNYTNEIGEFSWVSCVDDEYEESKIASGYVLRKLVRLFRNDLRIRNEGVIHDSVVNSIEKIGEIGVSDIPVHHFGLMGDRRERLKMYIEFEKKNLKNDFFQEYQIAIQLHSLGDLNEAVEHLLKSLELNTDFYLSWLELAIIGMKKGKIKESRPLLLRSLQLQEHEMGWNHLGIAEIYEKNYDKAIKCFEKAISMNGKNADFHFNLSQVLKQVGDEKKSREELEKASYLNPHYKMYL